MKITVVIGSDYDNVMNYVEKTQKKEDCVLYKYPETYLYPTLILRKIKDIVLEIKKDDFNSIIVTNSPYVLGELNNLLYAYKMSKYNELKACSIVSKEYWLSPKNVEAKKIMTSDDDGSYVECDIFDRDTELIMNDEIDEASVILNKEYELLSNLYREGE